MEEHELAPINNSAHATLLLVREAYCTLPSGLLELNQEKKIC